jgi:DNA-binding NarL/FixJ family response regulator
MTINVILVDDHTLVREAIARMISADPGLNVVGQAGSLGEARTLIAEVPAHVLVVDVSLPDGTGLNLVRAVRAASNRMGIVVLTMHSDDETLLEALDAGASSLVLKSGHADEVVTAVHRAHQSPTAFSAEGLVGALRRRDTSTRPSLTGRESEVLQRLVAGDSIATVAKSLYMSESTVKTHVSKVYDKLGVHNRAGAVMAAVRLGLVRTEQVAQYR